MTTECTESVLPEGDTFIAANPPEEMVNTIGTNIAQGIAVVIALFWNFFANRYWTYNDVE